MTATDPQTPTEQAAYMLATGREFHPADVDYGAIGTGLATLAVAEQLAALTEALETATATPAARLLAAETAAVRGELGRVDGKTGTLAGLAGVGLALIAGAVAAPRLETPVRLLLAAAAVAWAASALLLLLRVLRPRLGSSGFMRWADMEAEAIHAEVAELPEDLHAAAELGVLSRIARGKFRSLARAVDLLALGVVLLAAAILAGVIA